MKAESLFLASFAFLGGKFGDFDCVNIHCIGVMGFQRGGGERLIRVGWFDVSPSDFIGAIPLGLEMNGLFVPVTDGGGNGVHGHDMAHEGGGNPSGIVFDEYIFVINGGHGYVVLEKGGVFCEGWGVLVLLSVLSRFLYHPLDRKPGDSIGLYIMVFECGFETSDKNREGSHSDDGAYKGVVSKGRCPS